MALFTLGDRKLPNVLVHSDHGLMIVNRFDNDPRVAISQMVLDHGNTSTVEADLTVRALMKIRNPVIFDIGANIGTYATWVARWAMDNNGRVYCFEPQRQIFQMLCGNMAINNINNVHAFPMAIGKEETYIDLPEVDYMKDGSSFGAFSLDGVDRKRYENLPNSMQRVKLTTIDKFMKEYNVPKIDFMKIDAEGLDIDVIEGARETINIYKPDLLVEFLNLGSSKDEDTSEEGRVKAIELLQSFGYNTHIVHHDVFATMKVFEQL